MTRHDKAPVALITGASRGIGAATARRLAADGMVVALNSYPDEAMLSAAKHVASEIEQAGGHAAVYPADISDATAVDGLFSRCEQELGTVTALVLNAATTAREPWTEITEASWERITAVNLKGAFLCCRRAFGGTEPPPASGIVTISSVLARVGAPNALHYATTKAGILGFTRSLAQELGERGIRVNCVIPGAIQTEEELEAFPDQEAVRAVVFDKQILRRRGQASDVAGAVSFLLGPDSRFITGQAVCVDGGWASL
ncbi:MAG: SDR family oxidoreductase [Actinophytocola sp.]|nr:SDR family oxidoreductase [Actinophytocola sp.]